MTLPLTEERFREALDLIGGDESVCDYLEEELSVRRGAMPVRDYLDQHEARYLYESSVSNEERRIKDRRLLWQLFQKLHLELRFASQRIPWDNWEPGGRVVVLVGKRAAHIEEVSQRVKQVVVGARDAEAFGGVLKLCQKDLKLNCSIELELLDVGGIYKSLPSKGVGMIVCLGSPVVNPCSDLLAEEVLREVRSSGKPSSPPALFRWKFPHTRRRSSHSNH